MLSSYSAIMYSHVAYMTVYSYEQIGSVSEAAIGEEAKKHR